MRARNRNRYAEGRQHIGHGRIDLGHAIGQLEAEQLGRAERELGDHVEVLGTSTDYRY